MQGYKLRQINSLKDLEEVDMAFLIRSYHFEDFKGVFMDEGKHISFNNSNMKPTVTKIGVVVHGRLFIEDAETWTSKDGQVYVEDEEYATHF